jgi:NAD(P)-dependent dehydrogenase (short-subunit alcohol dehydrogenase family)
MGGEINMQDYRVDLTGKVAMVTGAAGSLGRKICEGFLHAGAAVILVDRNMEVFKDAVKYFQGYGDKTVFLAGDLTKVAEIKNIFAEVKRKFDRLDIIINNAGINIPKASLEITEDEWDKVCDVNLKACFFCCQEAARIMIKQRKGKIINISSQLGVVGAPERAPYCASKGGVIQLTRSLAVEWCKYGINVNAIAPTFMRTEMTESVLADPAFYQGVISKIPMGRVAVPDDMLGGILYLSSAAADMVTGHVLSIDGGYTAW